MNNRYDRDYRTDLRKARADQFTAEILRTIDPYLREDAEEPVRAHVARALFDLFYSNGFEAITDHMRVEAGLPLRDDLGWTPDEVMILERRRLEALARPMAYLVPELNISKA